MARSFQSSKPKISKENKDAYRDLELALDWSLSGYSILSYKLERQWFDSIDEFHLIVDINRENPNKPSYAVKFRIKDEKVLIHHYEDVYEEFSGEELWKTLFFQTL